MLAADLKAKSGSIALVVQQEELAPRGIAKLDVLPQRPAHLPQSFNNKDQ
jgi:hypothetical protein